MGPSQGSCYSNVALWEDMSVCLSLCLILTVIFEREVDTLHLAAIQCAVDTNLSTELILCQSIIWRQVRGSNITSQFQFFN